MRAPFQEKRWGRLEKERRNNAWTGVPPPISFSMSTTRTPGGPFQNGLMVVGSR